MQLADKKMKVNTVSSCLLSGRLVCMRIIISKKVQTQRRRSICTIALMKCARTLKISICSVKSHHVFVFEENKKRGISNKMWKESHRGETVACSPMIQWEQFWAVKILARCASRCLKWANVNASPASPHKQARQRRCIDGNIIAVDDRYSKSWDARIDWATRSDSFFVRECRKFPDL